MTFGEAAHAADAAACTGAARALAADAAACTGAAPARPAGHEGAAPPLPPG